MYFLVKKTAVFGGSPKKTTPTRGLVIDTQIPVDPTLPEPSPSAKSADPNNLASWTLSRPVASPLADNIEEDIESVPVAQPKLGMIYKYM